MEDTRLSESPNVYLYTDGSIGGWAFIREDVRTGTFLVGFGYIDEATNNQCELTAVYEGLKWTGPNTVTQLVSDSEYVVKGLTTWMYDWQISNWRKPNKNRDEWKALYNAAAQVLSVGILKVSHVRGHIGHPWNEACDQLAYYAAKSKSGDFIACNESQLHSILAALPKFK